MVKSIAASVLFALIAAAIIALPGFSVEVEASEVALLAKQETLIIQPAAFDCSKEVWPNLPAFCLQRKGSTGHIVEARLVTARR